MADEPRPEHPEHAERAPEQDGPESQPDTAEGTEVPHPAHADTPAEPDGGGTEPPQGGGPPGGGPPSGDGGDPPPTPWQRVKAALRPYLAWLWKHRKPILVISGALSAALALCFAIWLSFLARELPDVTKLRHYTPGTITRIYDVNGELMGEYFSERRVYVPLERIPRQLIDALLAVEDSRFYEHGGIDLVRIGGAVLANLKRGGFSQGGSTITQQLARTLFLTREKKLIRKIREALLSLKMERVLTKDEILELYLNEIYLGNGAYGVQAAAKGYFGKNIEDITLPEAAFLAGLPKAPSRYTPYADPMAAKKRQGTVLARMYDEGVITRDEFREAYAADLMFQRRQRIERQAPYFLEEVRKHLAATYGNDAVNQGGLNVFTTMDADMQQAAETAVVNGLRNLDKRQGWRGPLRRVSDEELAKLLPPDPEAEGAEEPEGQSRVRTELEPERIYEAVVTAVTEDAAQVDVDGFTGPITKKDMQWARRRLKGPDLIKDVVNLRDFVPSEQLKPGDVIHVRLKTANPPSFVLSQVPRAQAALLALDPHTGEIRAMVGGYNFNLSQFNRALSARRQSGSAFKPVVYATAFDEGYAPASVLMDTPIVFRDEETGRVWKPENYGRRFKGNVSLRESLVHSRNISTVKLLQELGIPAVTRFARRLGIESDLAPDLSLALGSSSVTVLEVARAYAVFASGGMRVDPYFIRRVVDRGGKTLELAKPNVERVISEETSYLISNVLEDVIRNGTGRRARQLRAHIGGKTGTTNDFTDAWFAGSSPNITLVVWVGMDDHTTLGNKETGAKAALPIWIDFMRQALKELPDEPFSIPPGIVYAAVDPETGLLAKNPDDGVVEVFTRKSRPKRSSTEEYSFEGFVERDMGVAPETNLSAAVPLDNGADTH